MTLIGEVPPGLAAAAARIGDATTVLDEDRVTAFVREQLAAHPFDGRSVCVLVPDATRTCPLPLLLRAVHGALHGRVRRFTVLVALGTHAPMGEEALAAHLGYAPGRLAETYPDVTVVNHENPYEYAVIRGRLAEDTHEGADENIDALAKKYLGKDEYPFRQPGEQRVIYKIEPTSVNTMG